MATNQMRPIHPGEVLREEFTEPLHISISNLANALHLPISEINDIMAEKRAIDANVALRLAHYFNTTAQFWLTLQTVYDLKITEHELGNEIRYKISPFKKTLL